MDFAQVQQLFNGLEGKIAAFQEKATEELKTAGSVSVETKNAIKALGDQQHEFASRLAALEQKGFHTGEPDAKKDDSWGEQFIKNAGYGEFAGGQRSKFRVEVKNTVSGSDITVAPDRRPNIVAGAFRPLRIEQILTSIPTSSNAIEYTRENVFTNNAAERAEGGQMGESAITFTLETMPVANIAHFIKITKQLMADAPALAAYINVRMRYGVDLKVENQIINGNGTTPNIGGFFKAGNFTAHGYSLATGGQKADLIRRVIAKAMTSDYPVDAILLNPLDWAEIELEKDDNGAYKNSGGPRASMAPMLWGKPVIESNAVVADTFMAGSFSSGATFWNRQDVVIELSDSDGDNFQKGLVTIRAERRAALTVEKPAAFQGGDLTPA
ncbi:phage major capsid protein [Herbaspirillum sp. GCM10030257]|uniref:phage major capsid protein n=1 Tax=Herbaspirillum sp. GCM10030257 TaxID=3273393 RepID=UPI003609AC48